MGPWMKTDQTPVSSPGTHFNEVVFELPCLQHDDVIKWKHFPRYWPFVRGIHRSPVNSPHKGQWRGAFMFSLICTWTNDKVNNRDAGDLRRHRVHYDVTVMFQTHPCPTNAEQLSKYSDGIKKCSLFRLYWVTFITSLQGAVLLNWFNRIRAWISNCIKCFVWYAIIHPCLNLTPFKWATVDVRACINDYISLFTRI